MSLPPAKLSRLTLLALLVVPASDSTYPAIVVVARRMQRFDAQWLAALMAWVNVPGLAPWEWIHQSGVIR